MDKNFDLHVPPVLDALMPGERIAWIPTWEGRYAATDRGRVFSFARVDAREMQGDQPYGDGRRAVYLREAGRTHHVLVAKCVLAALGDRKDCFDPEFRLEACHINGDHTDDSLSNLRWGSQSANQRDRWLHEQVERALAQGVAVDTLAEELGLPASYIREIGTRRERRIRVARRTSGAGLDAVSIGDGERVCWIPGWEGQYAVTSWGHVYSFKGRHVRALRLVLARTARNDRRYVVGLSHGGSPKNHWVHQLVALAFLGPKPSSKSVVRHLDHNPLNNRIENLAWGTQADNVADMQLGMRHQHGERSSRAKLSDSDVEEIRRRYLEVPPGSRPTQRALASEFGVSFAQISNIVTGKQRREDGRRHHGPGRPRGSAHYRASFTDEEVRSIRRLDDERLKAGHRPSAGEVARILSERWGRPIDRSSVHSVLERRTYKHIEDEP